MAALKKSSIALLLILGIMLGVNVASAQTPARPSQTLGVVTCQATAVPPVVRAEGIADFRVPVMRGIACDGQHLCSRPAQCAGALQQFCEGGRTPPQQRIVAVGNLGDAAHQDRDVILVAVGRRGLHDLGQQIRRGARAHASEQTDASGRRRRGHGARAWSRRACLSILPTVSRGSRSMKVMRLGTL